MKIVIPDDTHIISEEVMRCPSSWKEKHPYLEVYYNIVKGHGCTYFYYVSLINGTKGIRYEWDYGGWTYALEDADKHVKIFLKNKDTQNDNNFNAYDLLEVAKLRERFKNGNGE
jgi:hypothetical protein